MDAHDIQLDDRLFEALARLDLDGAREALLLGANPNAVDGRGATALHHAVSVDACDIARELLERGANPSALNASGHCPLTGAALLGFASCVDLLAGHPDCDVKSRPFLARRVAQDGHVDCLRALARHGADLEAADAMGSTPLILAALCGQTESMAFLIERGVNLNAKNSKSMGWTAAHACARNGHADGLELLAQAGADLNALDAQGDGALAQAAAAGHPACVALLLSKGVAVDTQCHLLGMTPTMGAAGFGSLECLTLLADAGADFALKGADGRDAAAVAEESLSLSRDPACLAFIRAHLEKKELDSNASSSAGPRRSLRC
jgi:ankyrin repeat protein